MGEKMWSLATTAAALAGASMSKKVIEGLWSKVKGQSAPENPADPDNDWKEALAYAVLSGAAVQVVKALVNRESTKAYAKATGELPASAHSGS